MKLRLVLAGTVCLAAGLSGHLASAQVADEVISTGTRRTVYDNPHEYSGWLLGYDEKCGPDVDEDCYDEDGDDFWEDGNSDGSNETTVTDEVVTVAERRSRFNLVSFLAAQLIESFPEIFDFGGAGSGTNTCAATYNEDGTFNKGSTATEGTCTPPSITLDLSTRPCSSDFAAAYEAWNYTNHTFSSSVWNQLGDPLRSLAVSEGWNSCATRITCGLNASGYAIPSSSRYQTNIQGGTGSNAGARVIPSAYNLHGYLTTHWGGADYQVTGHADALSHLQPGQVGIYIRFTLVQTPNGPEYQGHAGLISASNNDGWSNGNGSFWVLPTECEASQ